MTIASTQAMAWRRVPNTVGADTFEIYRSFLPTQGSFTGFSGGAGDPSGLRRYVIFVGLDMGPILEAHEADRTHIIWMAVILVLIGCSGVFSLFLAYRYRAARASLGRVQAFSDHLLERLPMGLAAVDRADRVVAFNDAAATLLGRKISDSLGRNVNEVLPEAMRRILLSSGDQPTPRGHEISCPLAGGRSAPVEVLISRLDGDEDSQGLMVLFRDLTEIQALKEEVARSQRLASLGSLAAGVAHEIRNPLSSIKGFATYFKERYRAIPEDRETAEVMISEVERLNRAVSQLLAFARPVKLRREQIALEPAVRQTLRLVAEEARARGIEVVVEGVEDIQGYVDPDQLQQVLLNLFLNALAAMREGGVLGVRAEAAPLSGLRLAVTDTGSGIDPEDLGRIFDPYFTTKPSGAGLGLAIVHKIMEAHGGEVAVTSEKGRGTTVTLVFPGTEIAGTGTGRAETQTEDNG
jgi:two-component system sensor histidine kinase HydH